MTTILSANDDSLIHGMLTGTRAVRRRAVSILGLGGQLRDAVLQNDLRTRREAVADELLPLVIRNATVVESHNGQPLVYVAIPPELVERLRAPGTTDDHGAIQLAPARLNPDDLTEAELRRYVERIDLLAAHEPPVARFAALARVVLRVQEASLLPMVAPYSLSAAARQWRPSGPRMS